VRGRRRRRREPERESQSRNSPIPLSAAHSEASLLAKCGDEMARRPIMVEPILTLHGSAILKAIGSSFAPWRVAFRLSWSH
jgi:hypothetical protein